MHKVLVTGGAGFIGSHLVQRLVREENEIVIIDNLSSPAPRIDILERYSKHITFYKEDIRNRQSIYDIVKRHTTDICIHLAGKFNVVSSVSNPFETVNVNVDGTLSVLEACARNGVGKFIFASSASVYGEAARLPIKEDSLLDPISPYGASKAAGEALIASYANAKRIKTAIPLRFFNAYGEGQNPEYAGVITKFAERLSIGLPPIIYGDGNQTRDFISVIDITDAIVSAMKSEVSGTYNIATGKAVTINQIASMMSEMAGIDGEPIYLPKHTEDIIHSQADVEKAKTTLHFFARNSFTEYLRNMSSQIVVKRK